MPRRSGFPKGSGEVLERDRGSKSPVSFQPPPRGANKIYTYDVVFPPGEARIKSKSQTPFPYKQHRKSADCKSIVACTASTPKLRGTVLDATASSYLPRGTYADCKSNHRTSSVSEQVRCPNKFGVRTSSIRRRDKSRRMQINSAKIVANCILMMYNRR